MYKLSTCSVKTCFTCKYLCLLKGLKSINLYFYRRCFLIRHDFTMHVHAENNCIRFKLQPCNPVKPIPFKLGQGNFFLWIVFKVKLGGFGNTDHLTSRSSLWIAQGIAFSPEHAIFHLPHTKIYLNRKNLSLKLFYYLTLEPKITMEYFSFFF